MATEDLTRALDEAGAAYELLPHAHTESALREAEALGLSPDEERARPTPPFAGAAEVRVLGVVDEREDGLADSSPIGVGA